MTLTVIQPGFYSTFETVTMKSYAFLLPVILFSFWRSVLVVAYAKTTDADTSSSQQETENTESPPRLRAFEIERQLAKKQQKEKKTAAPRPQPPSMTPPIGQGPTMEPSNRPSNKPSMAPSTPPSSKPSVVPSSPPSSEPSKTPSMVPSALPSNRPSKKPSMAPSTSPSNSPTNKANPIFLGGLQMITGSTRAKDGGQPFPAVPGTTGVTYCGTSITSLVRYYSIAGKDGMIVTVATTLSDFDVKLSVFKETFQNCIGGLDDAIFVQESNPTIAWASSTGKRYLLLVHGFMSETGTYELQLTASNVPSSFEGKNVTATNIFLPVKKPP